MQTQSLHSSPVTWHPAAWPPGLGSKVHLALLLQAEQLLVLLPHGLRARGAVLRVLPVLLRLDALLQVAVGLRRLRARGLLAGSLVRRRRGRTGVT